MACKINVSSRNLRSLSLSHGMSRYICGAVSIYASLLFLFVKGLGQIRNKCVLGNGSDNFR